MNAPPETPWPATADEAINQALRAEQSAREAIEACERAAQLTVTQARADARRIQERTDRRIARLHTACAERAEREAAAERPAAQPAPAQPHEAQLDAAIARLAARLTGANDPGSA